MTESVKPPRPLKALPAFIFLLGLIYLLLGIFQPLNPFDEGFINYGAERVSHGDVPYRIRLYEKKKKKKKKKKKNLTKAS